VFYPRAEGEPAVAPFVGDDDFLPHLLRVLGEREIIVELCFAPPMSAHGRAREELAEDAWAASAGGLNARRRALHAWDRPPEQPLPWWWWDGGEYARFARDEFRRRYFKSSERSCETP
jgi:hypothetical protein